MMIFDVVVTMLLRYKSFSHKIIYFIIQKVIYRKVGNVSNRKPVKPYAIRVSVVTNRITKLVTGGYKMEKTTEIATLQLIDIKISTLAKVKRIFEKRCIDSNIYSDSIQKEFERTLQEVLFDEQNAKI